MSVLSIKYESYFMNMVYSGRSLREIVEEGATILGTPVRFSPENRIEAAICSTGYPREDIEYITDLLQKEGSRLKVFLNVSQRKDPDKPFYNDQDRLYKVRIFCNVIIGSHYYGNLSIPQIGIDLHTVDLDMVHLLSRTIALSCAVSGLWGYDISRNGLLQRTLSGMITSQDELYAYLGNNISFEGKTWKLVCARIPENKEPVIIQTALQRGFDENPVVIHGHYAVMLIDVTYEDIGQRQINELHHIAATYQCTLGISVGFDHILQCREQMLCLAEHPQMIRKQVGVFDYNLCKENLLLFSSRFEKERLLKLIGGKLQEIREYDQKNNTAYFDTIRAYLNCSYHIQRTAESLHTHKNTLLYRLTRIQELFGIDLRNNQDIYAINLGLSTLHYFNII